MFAWPSLFSGPSITSQNIGQCPLKAPFIFLIRKLIVRPPGIFYLVTRLKKWAYLHRYLFFFFFFPQRDILLSSSQKCHFRGKKKKKQDPEQKKMYPHFPILGNKKKHDSGTKKKHKNLNIIQHKCNKKSRAQRAIHMILLIVHYIVFIEECIC